MSQKKSNEDEADARLIMFLLKKMSMEDHYNRDPSQAVILLADFLARTRDVIADEDWEMIARVGALLWKMEGDEIEASHMVTDLMDKIRRSQ